MSPAVAQVPVEAWETIFPRADVVTMNSREASALAGILDAYRHGSTIRSYLRADAATVRRVISSKKPRGRFHATIVVENTSKYGLAATSSQSS